MSKYYDMIATVDIDIASPIVDGTSFDNVLIIGPLPKVAAKKQPPKVGVYSSLDEVTEAGWAITGDTDPVGTAAQVAFSQSPSPTTVYIAPMQLTEGAIAAGKVIEAVNMSIASNVGVDPKLSGCRLAYDAKARIIDFNLTGPLSKVKNTGLFIMLNELMEKGYKASIDGKQVTNAADLKEMSVFERISNMEKGDTIPVVVDVTAADGTVVPFGIIVSYPNEENVEGHTVAFDDEVLTNPQNEQESAVETIQRALATAGWYVVCPAGVDSEQYEAIAAYVETQKKMFCYTENDFFGAGSDEENKSYVGDVYFRSIGVFGKESTEQDIEDMPAANHYLNVAFAVKWLGYSSGSETAAFKALAGVYPSELTTTEMNQLKDAAMNFFVKVGNKNITINGMTRAGEWCDVIRFRDWLQNDMQLRVVNLFVQNPKIPYTDNGIALVQNQMIASLKAGQAAGGIAEEEYDVDGNKIPGFETSVPIAANLTAAEKASRKLKNCKFKERLAGAIHFAEIKGSLTYEL